MESTALFRGPIAAAIALAVASLPFDAEARTTGQRVGAAIAPAFSIRHAAMRPFEEVTLVLGIHDDNPHASRDVATGDSFHFDFATGTLGECEVVSALSPSGALDATDWSCTVDGRRATLRHEGDGGAWPPREGVFAELSYVAPAASTLVGTSHDVSNPGAYSPPAPTAIALGVSPDIGSVGPQGPTGPTGMEGAPGPPGAAGTGASALLTTFRGVRGLAGEPARVLPGLTGSLTVEAGSRLLAVSSIPDHNECDTGSAHARTRLILELDGESVLSRERLGQNHEAAELLLLSDPLAEGTYDVRVLVENVEELGGSRTACYGAAADSPLAARLFLLELRQ